MTQYTTHRTTDHNLIRAWAEKCEAARRTDPLARAGCWQRS